VARLCQGGLELLRHGTTKITCLSRAERDLTVYSRLSPVLDQRRREGSLGPKYLQHDVPERSPCFYNLIVNEEDTVAVSQCGTTWSM
jgi:hypothetical protein